MNFISIKKLRLFNFLIIAYFSFLHIQYVLQLKWTIIGVFQELLTIPFMLVLILSLGYSSYLVFKSKTKDLLFVLSTLGLLICFILILESFLI